MNGIQFNTINKHKKFYKLLPYSECQDFVEYKTGRVDYMEKYPYFSNRRGIYFVDYENLSYHYSLYNQPHSQLYWVREVTLPNDAFVMKYGNEYRTDNAIMGERYKLGEKYEIDVELLKHFGSYIAKIKNPNEDICKLALKYSNGSAIQYMENQTSELCKTAIIANPMNIRLIRHKIYELYKLAISKDGSIIANIENPIEELCLIAIVQNPCSIQYIKEKHQTEYLCDLAVSLNVNALQYIKNIAMRIKLCVKYADE